MAYYKKTQSGKIDKRTKEYKELCRNAAKARRAKKRQENSLAKRLARLFK